MKAPRQFPGFVDESTCKPPQEPICPDSGSTITDLNKLPSDCELVDKYIDTAYDKVALVAEHIEEVIKVAGSLGTDAGSLLDSILVQLGHNIVGSFELGTTVTKRTDYVTYESKPYYYLGSVFPYVIPALSKPNSDFKLGYRGSVSDWNAFDEALLAYAALEMTGAPDTVQESLRLKALKKLGLSRAWKEGGTVTSYDELLRFGNIDYVATLIPCTMGKTPVGDNQFKKFTVTEDDVVPGIVDVVTQYRDECKNFSIVAGNHALDASTSAQSSMDHANLAGIHAKETKDKADEVTKLHNEVVTMQEEVQNNTNLVGSIRDQVVVIKTNVDDTAKDVTAKHGQVSANTATVERLHAEVQSDAANVTKQVSVATDAANTASVSAANAQDSESNAAVSASNANSDAVIASQSANSAQSSAAIASEKATSATNSEQIAVRSAESATLSESNAATSATQAAESARLAKNAADSIGSAVEDAQTAATQAQASATKALVSERNANLASEAAEAAQLAAETSVTQTQVFKDSAEEASITAVAKATEATTAASTAVSAKDAAKVSETNAATYETGAEQARDVSVTKAGEAKVSADKAQDILDSLTTLAIYRGIWNPEANPTYPDHKGTSSQWDVSIPSNKTITAEGLTWKSGYRLVYSRPDNAYFRVVLETGVTSVDGRAGAVSLTDKYLQLTGGRVTGTINSTVSEVIQDGSGNRILHSGGANVLGSTVKSLRLDGGTTSIGLSNGGATVNKQGTTDDALTRKDYVDGQVSSRQANLETRKVIELGKQVADGATPCFIDLHTESGADYNARILRWNNSHANTGRLEIVNEGKLIYLNSNSVRSQSSVYSSAVTPQSPDVLTRKDYVDSKVATSDARLDNLSKDDKGALTVTSNYGTSSFGMWNGSYCHMDTEAASGFYSYKSIDAAGLHSRGSISINNAPTAANHATRKDYVDNEIAKKILVNGGEFAVGSNEWLRAGSDSTGFLPSRAGSGTSSTSHLGNSVNWFSGAWVNSYRGGSVDVTGNVSTNSVIVRPSSSKMGMQINGAATYSELVPIAKDGSQQWSNSLRWMGGDDWTIGGRHKLYHQGFKPTAQELNVVPASATSGTAAALYYNTTSSDVNNNGIKIRLPYNTNSSKMVCFTVRVYQSYQHFDIKFSGYLYSTTNQWHSPDATVISGTTNITAKMGRDSDGRAYVWIDGGTYTGCSVFNVTSGYNSADWRTGWSLTRTDDCPNTALERICYPPYSPHNKPTPGALGMYTNAEIDEKVSAAGKVDSVNGKTGVVTLNASEVGALGKTEKAASAATSDKVTVRAGSTSADYWGVAWTNDSNDIYNSKNQGFTIRPSDGHVKIKHAYFNNKLAIDGSGKVLPVTTNVRSAGMYGQYDAKKISHIWSMGTSYKIPDDGANFGNLYGFAYKYIQNTTGGTMAGGHQAVWCENGVPKAAIGQGLWTSGNVYEGGQLLNTRYLGKTAKAADSSKLNGYGLTQDATADTVVKRDHNADIQCRAVRSNLINYTGAIPSDAGLVVRHNPTGDTFLRTYTNKAEIRKWLGVSEAYPVGSCFLSMVATNPSELLGYGTWKLLTGNATLGFGDGSAQPGTVIGSNSKPVPVTAHTHERGTMNITGSITGSGRASLGIFTGSTSGAFSVSGGASTCPTHYNSGGFYRQANFDASKTWTGETSVTGTANATMDVKGAVINVNVWQRTA